MNREVSKISSIAKELISYFLMHGATDVNLSIKNEKDREEINIYSSKTNFTDEAVEKIKNCLHAEREIENEEYYCQVIGINPEREELLAISSMIDDVVIKWNKPSLAISLVRKK